MFSEAFTRLGILGIVFGFTIEAPHSADRDRVCRPNTSTSRSLANGSHSPPHRCTGGAP